MNSPQRRLWPAADNAFREVLSAAREANFLPPRMTQVSVEFEEWSGHSLNVSVEFSLVEYRSTMRASFSIDQRDVLELPGSQIDIFEVLNRGYAELARTAAQRIPRRAPDRGSFTVELMHQEPTFTMQHAEMQRHLRAQQAMLEQRFFQPNFEAVAHAWLELSDDKDAEIRSMELLKRWLSPDQLEQYERDKSFKVVGSKTGKLYRIRHGRSNNIDELNGAEAVAHRWCFAPEGSLPIGDVMLAQKISIETDEGNAFEVANKDGGALWGAGGVALRCIDFEV